MNFDDFFKAARNASDAAFDYQCRLACGEQKAGEPRADWLAHGTICKSRLINIPTGLGKTAGVVLAWLYNRVALSRNDWPRRLVYCLPMRTLVEQTRDEAEKWLKAHDLLWDGKGTHDGKVGLHILMGGEDAGEWDIHPEREAILIGTQDMLLSRALNRGYGLSRYRWPMHFGLLNNDCLWVMDETQLMGVSIETSAQLDGFRQDRKLTTVGACPTWWMSATLDQSRLATVDHPQPRGGWPVEQLSPEEKASGRPHQLYTAAKAPVPAPFKLAAATTDGYSHQVAKLAVDNHKLGTLTLIVVNRVKRAQKIYEALTTAEKKSRHLTAPPYDPSRVALIHSRFRRADRQRHEALLFGEGDRIVVATQAVEAGVDVSARLLITELAPWSSLVQRIGRCNRRAELTDAKVLWMDIEPDAKGELLLPYSAEALEPARTALRGLKDASLQALGEVDLKPVEMVRPVIRRRDLVDLFDTTPDLCGQDLDISRYIREEQDNDVQFFWRPVGDAAPTPDEPPPQRDELCRASIGEAARFLKDNQDRVWQWNPLAETWEVAKSVRPGATCLLAVASGGYSDATGWTGDSKDRPRPCLPSSTANESYAGNPLSFTGHWQTLADHTAQVVGELGQIAKALSLDGTEAAALSTAALWHDVGKAHEEFQAMLTGGDPTRTGTLCAKSANRNGRCRRPGFRHELASALAWLLQGPANVSERDLVAYLIAAHHGKVRLSIRSLPDEQGNPNDPEALFARGIWDGDRLPAVPLGEITLPEVTLDLRFMLMGQGQLGPSWLARAIALRDRLGPFRLAFLETLLRAADARASREGLPAPKLEGRSGVSSGMELREESAAHGSAEVLTPAEQSLVADLVADGLSIQEKFRPEPLYKHTGKGHYVSNTVEEIRRAKEPKPKGDQP